jgi:type IV secretion system protein VirB6
LGPIFILCLLFDQTKQLFSKWLYYGIGTMFSMAVLSAMVSISLEMVTRVAASFWATAATGALLGADFTDGMTSQAMQQGGMGLILTTLIMTTPPMAAAFFQGTLGQFTPYGAFGQGAVASSASYPPGQGPVNNVYRAPEPSLGQVNVPSLNESNTRVTRVATPVAHTPAQSGQRGLAGQGE